MNGKTIACKDFGLECPFSVTSDDGQEAIDMAMIHLKRAHAEKLEGMSEEEKAGMMEKMEGMVA
jgi:predicted small metal-binding protein